MTSTQGAVDDLERHLSSAVNPAQLDRARRDFLYFGLVAVPFLVPDSVKCVVSRDAEELVSSHGRRRDLVFRETGNTVRRMRNVRHREIARYGSAIPDLYASAALRAALGHMAGEEVLECPYEPEKYVVTELKEQDDTHGWHGDDYSFALVWVIDCPPVEHGGFVQCVPHTEWDKSNPRLNQWFVARPIYSFEFSPGDLYLIRTDTTLHRVYPLSDGRRLIINMGYASRRDLTKQISHETMDNLWSDD